MNQGWVSLHRKLIEHPRYKDSEWLHVWIHLLMKATHADYPAVFDGKVITLKPGQLITGRHKIAEQTGVHESKVKRVLECLKSEHQIDQQISNRSSLITITNWHLYQKSDQQNGQPVTSQRPAGDQPVTTNNNIITEEQDNERVAKALPLPPEVLLWNSKPQLPAVQAFSAARQRKLNARRKDSFFTQNFQAALDRVAQSDFCLGKNDRGWKADFDWILQSDTVAKILEGKYDNRGTASSVLIQDQQDAKLPDNPAPVLVNLTITERQELAAQLHSGFRKELAR